MNLYTIGQTLENYVELGKAKTEYPAWKLLLLSFWAGVMTAFGAVVANTGSHAIENEGIARVMGGLLFSFGLGMVILLGFELFTGNSLITMSVLSGKTTVAKMLRNWGLVYLGNLAGAMSVAAGCAFFGQLRYSQGRLAVYTIQTAASKTSLSFGSGVVQGILCCVLVCMGVLVSLMAKDVPGRIAGAYLPTAMFVSCGFENSIANMYYIPAGLFALQNPQYAALARSFGVDFSGLSWQSFLTANLLPVSLGNLMGGVALALSLWACHLAGGQSAGLSFPKRRRNAETFSA